MPKREIAFVIALFIASSSALAAMPRAVLEQYLKDNPRYSARFEQRTSDVYGDTLQLTSGDFYLQRPNQFLWDQKMPEHIVHLSDGKRYWYYDEPLEQVVVKDAQIALKDTPIQWLLVHQESWAESFTIEKLHLSDSGICTSEECFMLIPQHEDSPVSMAAIGFQDKVLSEIFFNDNLEQTTHIVFSPTESKGSFKTPPNGFQLDLPSDTEILDFSAI